MRRLHRRLFFVFALVVSAAIAVFTMALVPEYADLAFLVAVACCSYGFGKLRSRLHGRARARRVAPFLEVLERSGCMDKNEADFQTRLFSNCTRLSLEVKPECPIRSGTRVDGWMRFDGDDWYITTKRGLDNQQRLRLQGEIEDILLHCSNPNKHVSIGHVWIVVVVGVPETPSPTFVGQLNALREYARHRDHGGRVSIKVYPV